ncbi:MULTISPECIES: PPOX class F420-dependent oxidoreductase [unclassified Nocardia]|uniref:PPOX class F420-dependent oxidoreductase n=1 Tax=unclassified Nocardia TaxID=2637762 RepID=UPI001CE3EBB7|nr:MULTISPECIES: PPOX class F420-dependent oxidoreductase [unclassified Nocardia]
MAQQERRSVRIARATYRLTDLIRNRRAFDVADYPPTGRDFAGFGWTRQCLLITFRRSGAAMPSPMNFGIADGKIYMRTELGSAKVRRLRADSRAVLVPCDFRGKPKGEPVAALGRLLPDAEVATADAVIAANWSASMRMVERGLERASEQLDMPLAYLEFTPA